MALTHLLRSGPLAKRLDIPDIMDEIQLLPSCEDEELHGGEEVSTLTSQSEGPGLTPS